MNAFHPSYVKTFMPEFMATIRKEEAQRLNGALHASKARATRESTLGISKSIADFPKTSAKQ